MPAASAKLQIKGLSKKAVSELMGKAKRLGVSPERYIRDLVREDLALDRKASAASLAELMGPGREVDEDELDRLVEAAHARHHRRACSIRD